MPILEGDPKYSKRGPDFEQKWDLKGTKRGPKRGPKKGPKRRPRRGPKTQVFQKIGKSLHVEIFKKLNLD